MQDYWKELIDKYFEGETSPEEERALRGFLARTDDPAFNEARAVLGYFSAQRSRRAARSRAGRLTGLLAAAAAIAIVAVLGHALIPRTDDTCIIYAYGEKNTDTQSVLDDVHQTLSDLFGDNQGPDVTAQLTELFN
jgi:hypothetical protein